MMKPLFFLGILLFAAISAYANTVAVPLLPVSIDLHNTKRLQRGAKLFMNYCSGCHSLHYLRYDRMAKDLNLIDFTGEPDANLLFNNLIFTKARLLDPITISMPPSDARQWFGVLPPDLSLIARRRGANWLYTYLKSFYADEKRPFGANNVLFPDTAMPNVLESLSGIYFLNPDSGNKRQLLRLSPGTMNALEFDSALNDLVHFLVYVGEPAQLQRIRIGKGVMIFLFILLIFTYQLKKLYWKKTRNPH